MKTRHSPAFPILILLFLLACNLASPKPTAERYATATLTATQPPTSTSQPTLSATNTSTPESPIQRVIILSLDGLRPDAIELAPMPNLLELMKASAYSLTAQTIRPSATLPAHSSMLTGLCPSKHGVDWNDYIPQKGIAQGTDLFDLTHAAGMKNYMYVGKEKLQQVTDALNIDRFVYINDRDKVVMQTLLADFPQDFGLLFIHFATTDDMGHVYGWLSPEQLSVVFRADEAIGELLSALDRRNPAHHHSRPRRTQPDSRLQPSRRHDHPVDRFRSRNPSREVDNAGSHHRHRCHRRLRIGTVHPR